MNVEQPVFNLKTETTPIDPEQAMNSKRIYGRL